MDPVLPKPDYLRDLEWYWPFAKFPLDPNDLFTTLHDRFNTRPFPLQDPTAFHRDVYECADNSDTIDEFYSQLEQRKAQRIEEMSEGWDEVSTLLVSFPTLLSCQLCYDPETRDVKMKPGTKNDSMAQRQFAFLQYARCMSFDNLVTFFDGYVRDQREEQERIRRRADEGIERMRRARAAKRAAAASGSGAIEATSSGSPRSASSRITRSKRKSPRNAPYSNSQSPAASAVATEKPEPASSSRRIGPHQADRLPPGQTAESSKVGKKRIDEDAPRSTGKRRRMAREDVGAEDVDSERLAVGQDQSGAPEAAPTPARRKKRKSVDDFSGQRGKKRARTTDSPSKRLRQSPRRSANQDQPGRAPSSTERDSSIPSTAVPSNYDPEAVDEDRIQGNPVLEPNKAFYIEEPTQSPSDRNQRDTVDRSPSILSEIHDMTQIPVQDYDGELAHLHTAHQFIDPNRAFYTEEPSRSPSGRNSEITQANQEITQADDDDLADERTTMTSTRAAERKSPKRKLQKKPRTSNRQRVDKRRSIKEQNPSSPKKQSRRKTPQERNPSPPTQRLLRSTRSSRRDAGQELWFLGDDSVARAVGNIKRT
ncbi:hypothetical protein TGAM01_v210276 [Trichoderma gamsii]|uniref:Uncharacterized protein n=1 Tax=Trichoderma gamsii TaxID=398673 RepID=A0A2P4Z9C0_9HYPO|nr:hypothetical protein TGAM01_v210276 [Trichoderma gamsii]PON20877.1 hypothetical protein TGAM01_v210276 [Trichoderma gamsii]